MDEKRVVDYFVVAGLPDNPLPLEEFSNEAILKPEHKQDPVIDIAIINRSAGEQPPKGFTCIEKTPAGFLADLNHGSIRSPEIFLCYKRGRNRPPLTDIGVLYEGKERVMLGCEVVYMTPQGRPANVNNSNSSRIYITYRRADESAASDTLTVTDICVILGNKGETPPHAFCQIPKNLNKGMVGSDVYLCYKKSMVKANTIAYNPGILSRYPTEDFDTAPFPESVPMFCLPMGATIESWSSKSQHPLPVFSTFILTGHNLDKVYGAAVTFYEEYPEERLTELQKRLLGLKGPKSVYSHHTVHINKSICLLSHWPFFDAFKKFLSYLYRISIVGPHVVPLERHISHFMHEVPFPSPQRPRILVQLNHESLCLSQPEETPLTLSGASFMTLLKNLGPENCLNVLLFVLLEHKILVHSLRPAVLTSVAEAMAAMIFPFHWQCPYIPLCPLGLSDVLNAPCPFIVGIDSRYFDLYDPPSDVTCVDLDTVTITQPDDRRAVNFKLLPKRPLRVLKQTLTELFETLCDMGSNASTPEVSLEMAPVDHDFRRRRKELLIEIEIQEAFLRFMACLLKGYKHYLLPITKAPTIGTTDATSLFNMQEFLRSRDKAYHKFFQQFMRTQTFIRFIEERTFISDKDVGLAFFDECCEKVDENTDEPRLIELDDSGRSELTVLIPPPEPIGLPPGDKYSYNGFPELKPELFLLKKPRPLLTPSGKQNQCPNSPMAKRTKQEIRSAQKIAQQHSGTPMLWAKCLLGHCFSLWFIHLPSYVKSTHSKTKALHTAYDVLVKMQNLRLQPPEEVCYRVLMQLCGVYQLPVLAVKVLFEMKSNGVQPNAITYGFYNKAMLESRWPSSDTNPYLLWTKLRNVIMAVAQFRRAVRRRSLSFYSNSESDFDVTSMDSFVDEDQSKKKDSGFVNDNEDGCEEKQVKKTEFVNDLVPVDASGKGERSSNDVVSDRGYSSMTQEDAKTLSKAISSEILDLDSPAGMEEKQEREKTPEKHLDHVDKPEKSIIKEPMSPRRKISKEHGPVKRRVTVASFQPIDPPVDEFRQRVGSIVRRSLSSVGSNSSIGTLRGSTYGSAAGLLITSQTSIDESVFDGDPSHNANDRIRKRHRSAGENRRGRLGLSSSWRTRHRSGDPSMLMNYGVHSQESKESEPRKLVQMENFGDEIRTDLNNSGSEASTPRKNGEPVPSLMQARANKAGVLPVMVPNSDLVMCDYEEQKTPTPLGVIAESKVSTNVLERTPVTENDPLGLFLESGAATVIAPSQQTSDVQSPSADLLTLNFGAPGESTTDDRSTSPTIVKSRSESAPADVAPKAVKRNLLIDLDGLDPFSNSDKSECNKLVNGEPIPSDLSERTRLHTISECSGASSGRQYRISESSTTSSYQSDGETWSPLSPQKEETDAPNNTVSSPQNIQRPMQRSESFSEVLKLAAKNVASKITEFKQSISSSTGSPTAGKMGSSLPKAFDLDKMLLDTDELSYNRGWRRASEASVDYLSRSDNILEEMGQYMEAAKSLPRNPSYSKLGSSAPNQTTREKLIPLKDLVKDLEKLDVGKFSSGASLPQSLHNIAMDVEMSSCSRCFNCNSLLYDEEIMAGWSADDSNLNTTCQFCASRLVPFLHIYMKDWRTQNRTLLTTPSNSSESVQSFHSMPSVPTNPITSKLIMQNKTLNTSDHSVNSVKSEDNILLHVEESKSDSGDSDSPRKQDGSNLIDFSPTHTAKGPIHVVNKQVVERRRCTSECLPPSNGSSLSRSNSRGKEAVSEDESVSSTGGKMGEFLQARKPSTLEPISVPYLSPLVLRKEVENILEHDGDSCLLKPDFVDEHPIIYWNLVWYFRRMDVSSHLPGLILTAKCTNKDQKSHTSWSVADSRHVLIRLKWDNTRIHEEIGQPMYTMWNSSAQSRTVSALLTEHTAFSKGVMHQIVQDVQCNDLLSPMKLVMNERRRSAAAGKSRHRSMYREILYLAFIACGREDIDHDAFDREYRVAFQKLTTRETNRLQPNDRPPNVGVIWCRKLFRDLEI